MYFFSGCPVLKGSKWILNKWMYSFDNFKKFPCSITGSYVEPMPPPNMLHYF